MEKIRIRDGKTSNPGSATLQNLMKLTSPFEMPLGEKNRPPI
jgi:hypothetical protein